MPEFDAFITDETGLLYRRDNVEGLAGGYHGVCPMNPRGFTWLRGCGRSLREQYDVDVMVERFAARAAYAGPR